MDTPNQKIRPAPRWFSAISRFGLTLLRPFFPARFISALEHMAWFLAVGGFNTFIAYVIFVLLLNQAEWSRGWALFGCYALGIMVNYQTFGRWVFYGGDTRLLSCFRYTPAYVLIFLCNRLMLEALVWASAWPEELCQFLLLPAVAAVSYVINRFMVFNNKKS